MWLIVARGGCLCLYILRIFTDLTDIGDFSMAVKTPPPLPAVRTRSRNETPPPVPVIHLNQRHRRSTRTEEQSNKGFWIIFGVLVGIGVIMVLVAVVLIASRNGTGSLVGTWKSEDGYTLKLRGDGTYVLRLDGDGFVRSESGHYKRLTNGTYSLTFNFQQVRTFDLTLENGRLTMSEINSRGIGGPFRDFNAEFVRAD